MRKMSIAREIRIQKLQTKNRMTGQTFNPSGATDESLKKRDSDYIDHFYSLTRKARKTEVKNVMQYYEFTKSKRISSCYKIRLVESMLINGALNMVEVWKRQYKFKLDHGWIFIHDENSGVYNLLKNREDYKTREQRILLGKRFQPY